MEGSLLFFSKYDVKYCGMKYALLLLLLCGSVNPRNIVQGWRSGDIFFPHKGAGIEIER